jgi:hypothetical protein
MSASRFNRRVGKRYGGYNWKMEVASKVSGEKPKISRQVSRALRFLGAYIFMRENYGGEPRKIRRDMARTLAKRKGTQYPGRLSS